MKSVCINQGNKCKWEKCWDVKIEFPTKRTTMSLLVWSSCSVLSPCASCKYDRFWHFYQILLCYNNTLLISSIHEQTWDPVDKGFVGKGLNITKYLLLFCDADSQHECPACRAKKLTNAARQPLLLQAWTKMRSIENNKEYHRGLLRDVQNILDTIYIQYWCSPTSFLTAINYICHYENMTIQED